MSNWTIGFSCVSITPEDYTKKRYYLAGYNRNTVVKGVLDDIYARTIWIDDNSGKGGISFTVLDTIGMSNKEVNEIRLSLEEFAKESNTQGINILFTHNHAGVDTQGLWGRLCFSGRNKSYMKTLKQKVKQSVIEAYNNRKEGKLFYGKILTHNMIHDNRYPYVHDDNLVRLRFEPEDKSAELYILNIGCHPELLGKKNNMISADWPCYMGRAIKEKSGAKFIFINGAIGAITSVGLNEVLNGELDGETTMKEYSNKMAEYALSIKDSFEIKPNMYFSTYKFNVPAENKTFAIAKKVRLITNDIIKIKNKPYKYIFPTEASLLMLDKIKILLLPGELFPEIALGGFLKKDNSARGESYERETLYELLGEGEKMIFGLANDEIGYIIPENDFYLSPEKPYAFWAIPKDKFGRLHYEETTCSGPYAAECITNAVKELVKGV